MTAWASLSDDNSVSTTGAFDSGSGSAIIAQLLEKDVMKFRNWNWTLTRAEKKRYETELG